MKCNDMHSIIAYTSNTSHHITMLCNIITKMCVCFFCRFARVISYSYLIRKLSDLVFMVTLDNWKCFAIHKHLYWCFNMLLRTRLQTWIGRDFSQVSSNCRKITRKRMWYDMQCCVFVWFCGHKPNVVCMCVLLICNQTNLNKSEAIYW